jgi:hypothetical protein
MHFMRAVWAARKLHLALDYGVLFCSASEQSHATGFPVRQPVSTVLAVTSTSAHVNAPLCGSHSSPHSTHSMSLPSSLAPPLPGPALRHPSRSESSTANTSSRARSLRCSSKSHAGNSPAVSDCVEGWCGKSKIHTQVVEPGSLRGCVCISFSATLHLGLKPDLL